MSKEETKTQDNEVKAGIKCDCGSRNTYYTGYGVSGDMDTGKGYQLVEGDMLYCRDCGRTFWC